MAQPINIQTIKKPPSLNMLEGFSFIWSEGQNHILDIIN